MSDWRERALARPGVRERVAARIAELDAAEAAAVSEVEQDTQAVLSEVLAERQRQYALFGVQSFPDGTGGPSIQALSDLVRRACDQAFEQGEGTWLHIFLEEVLEALAEEDPAKIRAELLQAMGVGVQWIEDINRRQRAQA